jgi:hypothetical protein
MYRFPLQNFFFLLILNTLMGPVQVTSVARRVMKCVRPSSATFLSRSCTPLNPAGDFA